MQIILISFCFAKCSAVQQKLNCVSSLNLDKRLTTKCQIGIMVRIGPPKNHSRWLILTFSEMDRQAFTRGLKSGLITYSQIQFTESEDEPAEAQKATHDPTSGIFTYPRKSSIQELFHSIIRFLRYLTEVTINTGFGEPIIVHQGFDECALLSSCLKLRNSGWV